MRSYEYAKGQLTRERTADAQASESERCLDTIHRGTRTTTTTDGSCLSTTVYIQMFVSPDTPPRSENANQPRCFHASTRVISCQCPLVPDAHARRPWGVVVRFHPLDILRSARNSVSARLSRRTPKTVKIENVRTMKNARMGRPIGNPLYYM